VTTTIQEEFGVTQPAVSMHLRVLRESGFADFRAEGARRLYAVSYDPLRDVDEWLEQFRRFWTPHLDALQTELARGKRERATNERSRE
jgi:DNA-binding transcriptional ArsR family regulator